MKKYLEDEYLNKQDIPNLSNTFAKQYEDESITDGLFNETELNSQIEEIKKQLQDPSKSEQEKNILASRLPSIEMQRNRAVSKRSLTPDEQRAALNEPNKALQTNVLQVNTPEQFKPSSEIMVSGTPGSTVVSKNAINQLEQQSSIPDETDKLISDYKSKKKEIESELEKDEINKLEKESKRQFETGIVGALNAFGQGLAAITGGSAKPLETSTATMKSIHDQQIASEERKTKTLKDRLQQAKAPLDEKTMEIDLRSRITKGKIEQALIDPNSEQSKQARANASTFIDNMLAQGVANKADPAVLQRLEQTKSLLEQMNAQQVQEFYNTLKPLSTDTSIEAKNQFEMKKLATQENLKLRLSEAKDLSDQKKIAQKEFIKDISKIAEQESDAARVAPQMINFKNDLDAAIKGDKDAAKRISQNTGVVTYLNARSYESKGVFTDNDLKALSQTDAGRTWFEQLDEFVSKGMTGKVPKTSLMRIKSVMDQNIHKFEDPTKYVRSSLLEKYKNLDQTTTTDVWRPYITQLERNAAKSQTKQPSNQPVLESTSKKVKFKINGKVLAYDPTTQSELIQRARDANYEEVP